MTEKMAEVEKRYYSIGEVATMMQVNQSLLRFWETEFKLKPKKNKKGDRQYTKDDIEHIQLIYKLVKEQGYTLQGANELIKSKAHLNNEHAEVIATLQKLKGFLINLRKSLD